ncbi:MAG: transporter permease [Microbacterium sp.]|nr:transporter permease [Microbacterium sp.]
MGILFVLPIVLSMFSFAGESWAWIVDLTQYLPSSAAQTVTTPGSDEFVTGLITLLAWPAATLLGGWAILRSTDA